MFDAHENGILNEPERALFDETRRTDIQDNMRRADVRSMRGLAKGFSRAFNDPDGNGVVTTADILPASG